MRRLVLIFLLFLFPALVGAGMIMKVLTVCDDCSGTLKFAWHMEDNDSTPDVTLGNPCGCSDGDTIGAGNGTPIFSTTQKSDGARSLFIDALDDRYEFAVTGDDLIEADNVKIAFDLWIVSYPSSNGNFMGVIYTKDDGSNFLRISLMQHVGTDKLYVDYYGQGTGDTISISGLNTGEFYSCEFQTKTGVAGNDTYLACGAISAEEDDDPVAMLQSMDTLTLGDTNGNEAESYYLDNVKIYPCDRY